VERNIIKLVVTGTKSRGNLLGLTLRDIITTKMIKGIQLQILILFFIISSSCSLLATPTKVTYLIPEGFTGGVIILYNQKDGITPEATENGKIIYRIPKDGFLKVKPTFENKHYKFSYFYVDKNGKKSQSNIFILNIM